MITQEYYDYCKYMEMADTLKSVVSDDIIIPEPTTQTVLNFTTINNKVILKEKYELK